MREPPPAPTQNRSSPPSFMRHSAFHSIGVLRPVNPVSPIVGELSMPVCPKIVPPTRCLPFANGMNPPTAHRHSSPTPRPLPRLPGSLTELLGRKWTPVFATNVTNLSVYSPVTIGSAPKPPSPPKF